MFKCFVLVFCLYYEINTFHTPQADGRNQAIPEVNNFLQLGLPSFMLSSFYLSSASYTFSQTGLCRNDSFPGIPPSLNLPFVQMTPISFHALSHVPSYHPRSFPSSPIPIKDQGTILIAPDTYTYPMLQLSRYLTILFLDYKLLERKNQYINTHTHTHIASKMPENSQALNLVDEYLPSFSKENSMTLTTSARYFSQGS